MPFFVLDVEQLIGYAVRVRKTVDGGARGLIVIIGSVEGKDRQSYARCKSVMVKRQFRLLAFRIPGAHMGLVRMRK